MSLVKLSLGFVCILYPRYIIYIKQGIYDESVTVDKKKANLTMVGDGSQKTIVTGNKSHAKKIRTFLTATFGKNPKILLYGNGMNETKSSK